MNKFAAGVLTLAGTTILAGAEVEMSIEIPRISVSEYHRPYVAVWLEKEDQSFTSHLALWYDQKMKGREDGTTWLKDLRQWWRKAGRELKVPADGISGATRPPGTQRLVFAPSNVAFSRLAPGNYNIVVEAARESGGRELVRIPFTWPKGGATIPGTIQGKGNSELGAISMRIKP